MCYTMRITSGATSCGAPSTLRAAVPLSIYTGSIHSPFICCAKMSHGRMRFKIHIFAGKPPVMECNVKQCSKNQNIIIGISSEGCSRRQRWRESPSQQVLVQRCYVLLPMIRRTALMGNPLTSMHAYSFYWHHASPVMRPDVHAAHRATRPQL